MAACVKPADGDVMRHEKGRNAAVAEAKEKIAAENTQWKDNIEQVFTQNTNAKLNIENTKLEWGCKLKIINNKIKGLSPYPGAWSFFENNGIRGRLKIFSAEIIYEEHLFPINKILIKEHKIYITGAEGYLNCLEIQLPNKKRMTAKALLNGYKFDPNSHVL